MAKNSVKKKQAKKKYIFEKKNQKVTTNICYPPRTNKQKESNISQNIYTLKKHVEPKKQKKKTIHMI